MGVDRIANELQLRNRQRPLRSVTVARLPLINPTLLGFWTGL